MNRPLPLLWCLTVLPFATLPWVSIAREQPQPWYVSHLLFHVVYVPLIVAAIWVAWRLATTAGTRSVRVMARLLAIAEAAAFLGHLGELVAVVGHGGFDAGEAIFDEVLHESAAAVTVPALMAGIVLVVAITAVTGVRHYRAAREPAMEA